MFSFTQEKVATTGREASRDSVSNYADQEATRAAADVRRSGEGVPEFRILRPPRNRKYPKPHATTYAVETETGVARDRLPALREPHLSRPPKDEKPAILYVSHHSADAELRDEPWLAELVKAEPERAFYAMDVRGIGESRPDTCGGRTSSCCPYGNDYFYAIHGIMLDRPYVGQKTFDVLRVLDWLGDVGHKEVHLVAKGWGTIPATFAAVLSDRRHAGDAEERADLVRGRGAVRERMPGRSRRSSRTCWSSSICRTATGRWRRRSSGRSSRGAHGRQVSGVPRPTVQSRNFTWQSLQAELTALTARRISTGSRPRRSRPACHPFR